jgi:cytochrome b561
MQKYKISSRILHWLMAVIIISLLAVGIYMTNFLPKDAANRMEIYNLHKSFGVLALILIAVRIINRAVFTAPALPETINRFEQKLAHLVHILLYVLMIVVPVSGYLMSNSFGYPVKLFSIEMPFLIEQNFELGKIFHEIHEIAPYVLIAILVLHISGAVKHRYFDKNKENDVLGRML